MPVPRWCEPRWRFSGGHSTRTSSCQGRLLPHPTVLVAWLAGLVGCEHWPVGYELAALVEYVLAVLKNAG